MSTSKAPLSLLHPQRDYELACGLKLTVRELSCLAATKFFRDLVKVAGNLVSLDAKGGVQVRIDNLGAVVADSEELSLALVTAATGLSRADIEALPFTAFLELLDACLEVNLTPEVLGLGKRIGRRITDVVQAQTTAAKPA